MSAFPPDAVVIALGPDAHEDDPYHGMTITTPFFGRIGARLAALGRPTVIVQEGGYLSDVLGSNLSSFPGGISGGLRGPGQEMKISTGASNILVTNLSIIMSGAEVPAMYAVNRHPDAKGHIDHSMCPRTRI